jgi:hypothetical protein
VQRDASTLALRDARDIDLGALTAFAKRFRVRHKIDVGDEDDFMVRTLEEMAARPDIRHDHHDVTDDAIFDVRATSQAARRSSPAAGVERVRL